MASRPLAFWERGHLKAEPCSIDASLCGHQSQLLYSTQHHTGDVSFPSACAQGRSCFLACAAAEGGDRTWWCWAKPDPYCSPQRFMEPGKEELHKRSQHTFVNYCISKTRERGDGGGVVFPVASVVCFAFVRGEPVRSLPANEVQNLTHRRGLTQH